MNNYYFVFRKSWMLLLLVISIFAFGQQNPFIDSNPGTGKTWTVPAGVTSITVEIWGGGGAGGGSQNKNKGGGGGGCGYATKVISVIPGHQIIYTIGKGGTGSTGNGTAGETSTVTHANSSTSMSANGGGFGTLNNGAGAGGTAFGGSANLPGANGSTGGNGGNGGNGGAGGVGGNSSDGNDGNDPGGGGGGGEAIVRLFSTTSKSGGDGGNGQLKITYATPTTTYKAQILSASTGSTTWCPGETRKVSVTVKNSGTAPWITGGGQVFNIGVKWNTNGTSWNDYNVRVSAENLAAGATKEYFFEIKASNNLNDRVSSTPGYTTPLATGNNNLTFDVVFEAVSWFGDNYNGVGPGNTVFKTPTQNISLPSQIGNNELSYSNGTSGKVSATATEYTTPTGTNAVLNAPAGSYFSYVNFASYGQPNGTAPNYTIDPACHSATSQSVTESYLLGNATASIPPTNAVFGDPCVNKLKRLYVVASYVQPICKGSSVSITGTTPTGGTGTFTYVWESSTTSAKNGFEPAAGLNNLKDYTSGAITQTTWFRRVVTSCGATSTSSVVMVMVDPVNGGAVASEQTICAGTAPSPLTLSGHIGTVQKWQRSTDINFTTFTDIANTTTTLSPGNLLGTTYFRAVVKSNICTANSIPVLITVNPIITASVSISVSPTNIICVGSETPLTFNATPINGGATPTYQWYINENKAGNGRSAFTIDTLKENDVVTVTMTSNASPCLKGSPATSNPITIITQKTVYTGAGWSMIPAPNLSAEIQSAYTITANLEACKLLITNNAPVTIKAGDYFKIQNGITVEAGSSLTLESDANLVQVNNNPVPPNSGDITSKRTIALRADRNQYNYLISPVIGQSLKTIYPNIDFVLYYNESNNYFYSSSGAYIAGRGLAVKVPNANTSGISVSANFKGVPANGMISFPLAFSSSSRGSNLSGNPYPSAIDLKALYTLNKSIINSTFSYWDNSNNTIYSQQGTAYEGNSYAKYNAVSDTGTPAGGNADATIAGLNRYAKVGQGFIVQALSASSLTFNNSIREIVNHNAKFYGKTSATKNTEIKDRYWLQLLSPTGIVNTQAVVYFLEGDDAFGKDDSEIDDTISDVFYSVADAQKLIIQGKSIFTDTDKVKLGANIFQDGSYKITLENPEGIFASAQNIYLKDKQEGIITNLSEGSYTFNASKGNNATRFEIIYQPETVLATDSKTKEQLMVYKDGSDFVVKSQSKNITGLEVYDATGRLITQLQPNQTKVIIPAESLVNGVYILKINQNGVMSSKKIIK